MRRGEGRGGGVGKGDVGGEPPIPQRRRALYYPKASEASLEVSERGV